MTPDMEKAFNNVGFVYQDVIDIANQVVNEYTAPTDDLIRQATSMIESLSNDAIRELLLKLSMQAYSFGDVKEKAAFKAVIAKTLKDEARARSMQTAEGTVSAKDNIATLAITAETMVTEIYSLAAALLKTKLDEIHRIVDTLKTVLTTRLSEAKLSTIGG